MSKTRIKKTMVKGTITQTDAEAAFGELAKADARRQQITAKMDLEMSRIREKHQDELTTLDELINDKKEYLSVYASQNPDLFLKQRSIELVHGKIGFRTGTPKLKLLKSYTWAKVLDNLRSYLPKYIRTTEEPAKDRLLVDREIPEVKENLTKCGIMVDQDETFFCEPYKEELATA